ncbi:MAG: glycosyltransferase [Bacteroidaceae bacterium]|nr:glycosyltransferase [Bacteroidaceae bacterium]
MISLSIITINRNNLAGLDKTLCSIAGQNNICFEHVIVDGASFDGSANLISEYAEHSTYPVKWVSEPDSGIYNAMNKGIRMSTGDYLLFLNSGDILCNEEVVEHIFPLLDGTDIVIGQVNVVNSDGKIQQNVGLKDNDLTLFSLYLYGIPHQGCVIKKDLFNEYLYDESLKINADWKFFLQTIIIQDASVNFVPLTIADYDGMGISSTNHELLLKEREEIFLETIPTRIASDYVKVFPHYYEAYRVEWLLRHPFFYRVYRVWVSLGMKFWKK